MATPGTPSADKTTRDKVLDLKAELEALRRDFADEAGLSRDEFDAFDEMEQMLAGALKRVEAQTVAQDSKGPVKPLSGPVGAGGRNAETDVRTVQSLLNDHGASLETDGVIGPKTVGAITKFQTANLGYADGRVDPGGGTWSALTGGGGAGGGAGDGTEPANIGGSGGGGFEPVGGFGQGGDSGGAGATGADGGGGFEPASFGNGGGGFEKAGGFGEGAGAQGNGAKSGGPHGAKGGSGGDVPTAPPDLGEVPEPEVTVKYDHGGQTPGPKKPREVIEETTETTYDNVFIGELKIKRNQHGDIVEVNVEPRVPFQKLTASVGKFMEATVQPVKVDYNFAVEGKKINFEMRLGAKCGAAILYGFEKYGAKFQIKGEATLEGYVPSPYRAVIDTEDLAGSRIEPNEPIVFALGGGVSAAVVIASGGFEFSETLKNYNYEKLLVLELAAGPKLELKPGPDYEKLKEDLMGEAKERVERTYRNAGNGGGSGGGSSDKVESHMGEAADKALLSALRGYEENMRAAHDACIGDPKLVGKANALYQQDKARAKQVYGQAWTQRALAKQSYDQYFSPADTASAEIVATCAQSANSIAGKFHAAIALFKQGDASW